jgi:hypothetical protein
MEQKKRKKTKFDNKNSNLINKSPNLINKCPIFINKSPILLKTKKKRRTWSKFVLNSAFWRSESVILCEICEIRDKFAKLTDIRRFELKNTEKTRKKHRKMKI